MSSHLHVGFRSFVIYPCLAGEKILKEKCLEIERGPERGRSGRGGACPPPVSFFQGPDGPGGGLPERRDAGGSGRVQASGGGPHDSAVDAAQRASAGGR